MFQSVLGALANSPIQPAQLNSTTQSSSTAQNADGSSFSQYLSDALNQVNQSALDSQNLGEQLAAGQVSDIHTVMIAAQKATLELQLATQVRDKVIGAYQEIMRMQV